MPIHFLVFLNLQYSPLPCLFFPLLFPFSLRALMRAINCCSYRIRMQFVGFAHARTRGTGYPGGSLTSCHPSNRCFFQHQVTLHDPRLQDPAGRLRDLAAPRRTITIHSLLHEGTFGRVCRGEYTDEETGTKTDVLIKTVSGERDASYSTYQNLVHTG